MSWINDFFEFTEETTSPSLFRRWAAIWTIGAVLERRVWVTTSSPIYPNLYVVLVAPPGVGKTESIWRIRDLMSTIDGLHLSPSSVTKASLIDELSESECKIVRPQSDPPVTTYHSLQMCINELGVLLPAYENDFMNTLTDIYDGKGYGEKRRTKKIEINIPNPQINLISGTTPAYLNQMLPEGAWDQGFMSRTFVIYSGDRQVRDMFALIEDNTSERDKLAKKLNKVHDLFGQMTVTEETKTLINNWYKQGGPPTPEHPKLVGYNSRRGVHLVKLAMIAAADELSLTILPEHFHRALDWLIEAEHFMPDVFKAFASGGAGKIIEETWYYLFTIYSKEQKPIGEHRLIQYLQERVPVHQISQTIEMMERAKLIKKSLAKSGNVWTPQGKHHDG